MILNMPKRKRNPEEKVDEEILNATLLESRPKRRRNDTTLVDTVQYIFDALRNKKKDDDIYLCEAFLRVPRKKTEPQYYEVVKKPIDMLKIQQKIKTDIYNEIEEFCEDVELLVENAKLYYAKSTDEFKDACELWDIFLVAKKEAPEEINKEKMRQNQEDEEVKSSRKRGRPPKASLASSAPMIMEEDGTQMTVEDAIEELFGAIVTASDSEGRIHSYDFQLLPAPERYPDYYQLIQQPIDLKTIALHIQARQYENLESLERDMSLMFDNACAFNEPGSRIFKDARILKNLVQMRKQDLLHVLNAKKSVRLRSKRPPGDKKWSELVATLNEGEVLPLPEDEQIDLSVSLTAHDDDDSDVDIVDHENPLWQLFLAAKSLAAPNDPNYLLVEPFRRLPNRRWHSDYYQEIKNPISLSQIKKKAMKGEYRFVSEMAEDFDLMLDNAQQYNRPDSRIYRDAVKLQKFVHAKAEELGPLEEENQDSESDSDDNDNQMGSKRKSGQSKPWTFKRRAKLLFKTLMDFMTDDGRQPIVAFIEKPSKKDYPNYYEVITEPMDMEMIEAKIKSDQYLNDDELISDFRLMFKNCQTFNKEGSQIYKDANILSKVLNDKLREIQCSGDVQHGGKSKVTKKNKYSQYLTTTKNIKLLYNAIKEYRDRDNRLLSEVFMKLPPKNLYPDYYEVIKHPIDLERILNKWKEGAYGSLNDILNDVTLMFQNACRYNEPESQIYRDALTLQRLALQKRLELTSRDETVPNVGGLVQELLMSLFISVFNLEEEDGRYTAESFSELPDCEEVDGQKTRMISFDIVKRRLDKGLYTRLDRFQADLFSVFERARKHSSKVTSRLFMDSVTLQKEYMKVRDELCSHGSILKSKALDFKEKDLEDLIVNWAQKLKAEEEAAELHRKKEEDFNNLIDDEDSKASVQSSEGVNNSSSVSHNEIQYHVGDFVYVKNPDVNGEYPIIHIQRLWTNNENEQMLYGCQYYRPIETFHLPTRKFYEQEIFKTDKHMGVPLTDIIRKCVVLSSIDYVKLLVEDFDAKDIYVCESRYSTKHRFFKKIKVWPFNLPEGLRISERSEPIDINRVGSVFKDRINKHKEEFVEGEEETKNIWDRPPNVIQQHVGGDKGNTFYQQYNISSGNIKLGDFVYVRSSGVKSIRHITRIWVSPEGNGFFMGSRYVMVSDVSVSGTRNPYKNEVYLTSSQDTLPLSDIFGRCCVLFIKEYIAMRHTEIPEKDVYVCENFFDEMNQRICGLQSGIVKFNLLPEVAADEIYYFWRSININKLELVQSAINKKLKSELMQNNGDMDNDDSMDGPPPSIASADSSAPSTPKPTKKSSTSKKQSTGKKVLSGYILFSGEIRKSVMQKNPEANFGEISRLVGNEWKRLTESERKAFEDRAHQVNLESAERALLNSGVEGTPQSSKGNLDLPLPKNPEVVFECMWEMCDFIFEDVADLYDHLLGEPNGHIHKVKSTFECCWRGCSRHKKSSLAPFMMIQRLARHMREVHILKNNGIYMQHGERSRNFLPSSRKSLLSDSNSNNSAINSASNTQGLSGGNENQYQITFGAPIQMNGHLNSVNGVAGQKPMDPLFVSPPPKTHRLFHSEAYIKYIENLDKHFVSNWEQQLSASGDKSMINDTGRLPAQWLSNGSGNHGSVVNALWALREYMMKDSLGIAKIL